LIHHGLHGFHGIKFSLNRTKKAILRFLRKKNLVFCFSNDFKITFITMKYYKNITGSVLIMILLMASISCQNEGQPVVKASIAFDTILQEWDGFGVNYVEVAQSTNPVTDPQEYGGFSLLAENKRQEIINLIFGEDGLQPSLIKMFFDPFHQPEPGARFDHELTTAWMRYFVKEGIKVTNERNGDDIQIITTLYGPPAWATKQKILRGRDLDPEQYKNLALYMIDWVKYLVEEEGLPVKYLSLHNEGDSPNRWPIDGSHGNIGRGHDYNAFWRPTEVAHFLDFMPPMIKNAGLDVGLTPGECTNWNSFASAWYHWAIHDNPEAMKNIALITSHGFGEGTAINSIANDLLRLKRPDLHAWTTSMTWGNRRMVNDYDFVNLIRRNIYDAKVNAVIPWACIQTLTWVGGDPNPGTAFFVSADGNYEVKPQYYYYKQLTRAGKPGMAVAKVNIETKEDTGVNLIAFSSNGTNNSDAFIVTNFSDTEKVVEIVVSGAEIKNLEAFRSSSTESYSKMDAYTLTDGIIIYNAPSGSVTTFFNK
jgi:O-glycosyl hydrolase